LSGRDEPHSSPRNPPFFAPHRPFDPKRLPFFYGYAVVLLGAGGVLASAVGQTVGVSAFTNHLVRDLGIDRSSLSLAYLAGTTGSALMLPRLGRTYDRLGARVLGFVVAIALGLTLILMSFLPATVPVGAAVTAGAITGGFFLLRFLGQGAIVLVSRNMVVKWFERYRGIANAVLGGATTIGFSAAPLLFTGMIGRFHWTGAWRMLGIVLAIPVAFSIALFFRDNPQECGLAPDGPALSGRAGRRSRPAPATDFTLQQARRTLPFWIFCALPALSSLYFTGLTFHVVSIFEKAGLPSTQALGIFLPASFISFPLGFVAGWLSDQVRLKYLAIVMGLGMIAGMTAATFLEAPWAPGMLKIGMGVNGGIFGILLAMVWPRYFGIRHLGAISGAASGFSVAGSALGPYLFSLTLDLTGSYRPASLIAAAITLVLAALTPFANRPAPPHTAVAR
jgi:MFS transporter, OFA family, oxalate/formate antiporter